MMDLLHDSHGSQGQFRNLIFEYLSRYLQNGNAAMITYADKRPPVQSADAFRQLLGQFDWLGAYSPPLQTCLQTFSGRPCPQVESVFSWSTAKFGLRPLSTLTHTMIQKSSLAGKPAVFIALKQIYADHYFDAALGLAVLGEDSAEPSHPAVWLAYVERSQTDDLQSWLGPVEKAVAEQKARSALQKDLAAVKVRLERRYSQTRHESN